MKSSSRSSSRKSDIIRIKRPSSVDPRQPNISYRIPSVSGYHSRCTSPATEMNGHDYFDQHPSQVKLSLLFPDSREQFQTTMKPLAIGPKTQISKKFMQKTIGYKQDIPIAEFRSRMSSPRSQATLLESQSSLSQRERMETEMSFMGKTRMTKRLAQIVPHRIDQPYFMAGSTAKLSKRSSSTKQSPLKSKSEYEVDEEDFEKLRLRADSRNSRASSSGARQRNGRQRQNTPTKQKTEDKTGRPDAESRLSGMGAENSMQDDKNVENNEEEKEIAESGVDAEESSFRFKSNKIITTGNFAESQDSSISLTDGIDFSKLDPSELCIVTRKQRRAFEGMFNDIDFDKNGKVTFNELMLRMFSNVSKKDAKLLMQIFDINKDKTIDRREFIAICALNDRLCGYMTESRDDSLRLDLNRLSKLLIRYKELFALLDQDDNNKIHVDEIMLIMTTAMGKEIGMDENIARSIVDAVDKDKYGYIDFVSFLLYIPFFLKLYKAMMDSSDIELQELEETRILIRNQLRKNIRAKSSKK